MDGCSIRKVTISQVMTLYKTNKKSIAVLPFQNLSNNPENEYFCDGLTEEIINALTKIQQLKVIARTSSFAFKGKVTDIREIGEQLGVSTILEGSIQKSSERVRINTQLIDVEDGTHYWSKKFDRKLVDIFELEDEISLAIADEIRNNFGHFEVQERLFNRPTNSIDAYQFFLRGRSSQLKWTPDSIKTAISYYNEAIARDKDYAKAYYANLQCYGLLAMWGYMRHEKALELAIDNLLIAKELDASLPEYPLSYVGKFFWEEWDFKNAYIHINKVLAIQPNHIDGLEAKTELFIALGFYDMALRYVNKLLELDPLSANHHYTLSHIYYYKRQFKKALDIVDYAYTLNPDLELAHHLRCFCLIWLNKKDEFEQVIQNTPLSEEKMLLFRVINEKDVKISEHFLNNWADIKNSKTLLTPYDLYILANSNHKELAFSILKEKVKQRRGQIINFRNEPFLDALHKFDDFYNLHHSNLSLSDVESDNKVDEKPISTILDANQIELLKQRLLLYFDEEEPFLNPQLNLKLVADILEISTNKMSFLINQVFNVNFNDFVNSYRLKYFKTIALKPKNSHLTILGLAYDSGFNSKSVFNTFFKKNEGITPSKWVRQHAI